MKMNICFVTDDYYAMPTCVTISSIVRNKKSESVYNIFILCKNVSQDRKDKFMELNSDTVIIKIIDVEEKEDFSVYKIDGIPATPTAMYKFFIPEILKDIDRVLYLDGDIIVQKDLINIYNTDLKDNFIGAVKDTNGLDYDCFISNEYGYFNSGVLLMDLHKMRENNLTEQLLDYRKNGFNKLMDQDTFNVIFKDFVLLLPFQYNTQMNTLSSVLLKNPNYTIEKFKKYWGIQEEVNSIKDIFEYSTILHYTTAKPWKYYDGYGNDLWLEHYIYSPYRKEKLYRENYYIQKLVNSSTYQLGRRLSFPIKILKRKFQKSKNKKYKEFLNNFYIHKREN